MWQHWQHVANCCYLLYTGEVATGGVDYANTNTTVTTPPSDQDLVEVCPSIDINSDVVVERTEYFTASLYLPGGMLVASCPVAIRDGNGGMYVDNVPPENFVK